MRTKYSYMTDSEFLQFLRSLNSNDPIIMEMILRLGARHA